MVKRLFSVFQTFSLLALASAIAISQNGPASRPNVQSERIVPSVDHHQHLFSQTYVDFQASGLKTITAQNVIELLDKAGIQRAVLLSTAYSYGRPGKEPPDEYAKVKAEIVQENNEHEDKST